MRKWDEHLTFSFVALFSWNKLTDRFFKNSPWPEAEAIATLVGNGEFIRSSQNTLMWFCRRVYCGSNWQSSVVVVVLFLRRISNEWVMSSSQWSSPAFIVYLLSPLDAVFLILYKELYYRHIYAKVSVSKGSMQRYVSLSILLDRNVWKHFLFLFSGWTNFRPEIWVVLQLLQPLQLHSQ